MIAERREQANLTPEQLTERLGRRSKSLVYRLESEAQEPTAADINALTATLPLSAEELLKAMGIHMTAPAAAKLPRHLVEVLVELDSTALHVVEETALGQLLRTRQRQGKEE